MLWNRAGPLAIETARDQLVRGSISARGSRSRGRDHQHGIPAVQNGLSCVASLVRLGSQPLSSGDWVHLAVGVHDGSSCRRYCPCGYEYYGGCVRCAETIAELRNRQPVRTARITHTLFRPSPERVIDRARTGQTTVVTLIKALFGPLHPRRMLETRVFQSRLKGGAAWLSQRETSFCVTPGRTRIRLSDPCIGRSLTPGYRTGTTKLRFRGAIA